MCKPVTTKNISPPKEDEIMSGFNVNVFDFSDTINVLKVGVPCVVIVKVLDCGMVVNEIDLQSDFKQIPLGKVRSLLPPPSYGLNRTTKPAH